MDRDLVIASRAMSHPDAVALTAAMTTEVSALYGTKPGRNRLDPRQFTPPTGGFLVAYLGERAVACAGFRHVDEGLAQMHRVFVAPDLRGHGLSRRLLTRLEELAASAGYRTMQLETGVRQPAATRLYVGLGYEAVPCFPPFDDDPNSRCYAKRIG
ncbi:MAG: hypothetical protein QOJ11_2312 [Frankiales bacterium]|jgi:GNAT superfamily N-acetyltransferase|nr:hypothetical protein [Frankiales bacterium]